MTAYQNAGLINDPSASSSKYDLNVDHVELDDTILIIEVSEPCKGYGPLTGTIEIQITASEENNFLMARCEEDFAREIMNKYQPDCNLVP